MTMPKRRTPTSHLFLFTAALTINAAAVHAQPQQARQAPPLQPLGDVLHQVLDKDKNQKVTLDEVNSQITMLEMLFQGNGGGEGGEDAQVAEYRAMLQGVKAAAPKMFELLDSSADGTLSKSELTYATKFEKSLGKGGGMRDLLRDVFGLIDADGDDRLSADELLAAMKSDDTVAKVTARFHELFPLRRTPAELEGFVRGLIESLDGSNGDGGEKGVAEGIAWIDDDGDGYVERKEVGKYYNLAGKKFLEVSKTIKQMGPMLAMFGGGGMGGGGGRGEF